MASKFQVGDIVRLDPDFIRENPNILLLAHYRKDDAFVVCEIVDDGYTMIIRGLTQTTSLHNPRLQRAFAKDDFLTAVYRSRHATPKGETSKP